MAGLVLSGLTAFPLERESRLLARWLQAPGLGPDNGLLLWVTTVRDGLTETYRAYRFIAYGTDWLAFAHLTIAIAFIGPWLDPVRNKWVLQFGMIACAGVISFALIAGPLRGIPPYWRLIDCSFGMVGVIPLWICLSIVRRLEAQTVTLPLADPSGALARTHPCD